MDRVIHARRCGPRERGGYVGRAGRESTVDADSADPDGVARVLAAATDVLRQHTPDAGGWCSGCLRLWGRLAPFPCESAKWAAAVRATYTDAPG